MISCGSFIFCFAHVVVEKILQLYQVAYMYVYMSVCISICLSTKLSIPLNMKMQKVCLLGLPCFIINMMSVICFWIHSKRAA